MSTKGNSFHQNKRSTSRSITSGQSESSNRSPEKKLERYDLGSALVSSATTPHAQYNHVTAQATLAQDTAPHHTTVQTTAQHHTNRTTRQTRSSHYIANHTAITISIKTNEAQHLRPIRILEQISREETWTF
jgi:hypothetical protein